MTSARRSFLQVASPIRWILRRLGIWTQLASIDTDTRQEAYDRYGFRVPAVVVSPYSQEGEVSSTVYDHTSILRMIGTLWSLPPLTDRVRDANDPLDDPRLFDFSAKRRRQDIVLTPPAQPWKVKASPRGAS